MKVKWQMLCIMMLWLILNTRVISAQAPGPVSPVATPIPWNPDSGTLPTDPRSVLGWVMGGGAVIIANALLAYAYARWPYFARLNGFEKRALAWGTSLLLSVGAYKLLTLPDPFWARVLEFWPLLAMVAVGLLGQQGWYHLKEKPRG